MGEFRKKINEYIRLAQIQCERGLIDKAIDCNSQAMKFCKDKDPECLRRLQAQNVDLVARKLKESIARIERGVLAKQIGYLFNFQVETLVLVKQLIKLPI